MFQHSLWKFDYSGIGDSVGNISFVNWLNDADIVLKTAYEHDKQKIDLIGSSMGALIAIHLALANREYIRSIYLCAPAKVNSCKY